MKSSLGTIVLSVLTMLLSTSVWADGMPLMELAEWQERLAGDDWRVLLGNKTEGQIGIFMAQPSSTEIASHQPSLSECGINTKTIVRNKFPNPKVPRELSVSSPESRNIAPAFDRIILAEPSIVSARLLIENPRWVRLLTTDTTAFLHSSAIWGNPNLRAALIACIQKVNSQVVVSSVLTADVIIAFYGKKGIIRQIKALQSEVRTPGSFFYEGLVTSRGAISVGRVTLARQRGICTNLDVFFRTSAGNIGEEAC